MLGNEIHPVADLVHRHRDVLDPLPALLRQRATPPGVVNHPIGILVGQPGGLAHLLQGGGRLADGGSRFSGAGLQLRHLVRQFGGNHRQRRGALRNPPGGFLQAADHGGQGFAHLIIRTPRHTGLAQIAGRYALHLPDHLRQAGMHAGETRRQDPDLIGPGDLELAADQPAGGDFLGILHHLPQWHDHRPGNEKRGGGGRQHRSHNHQKNQLAGAEGDSFRLPFRVAGELVDSGLHLPALRRHRIHGRFQLPPQDPFRPIPGFMVFLHPDPVIGHAGLDRFEGVRKFFGGRRLPPKLLKHLVGLLQFGEHILRHLLALILADDHLDFPGVETNQIETDPAFLDPVQAGDLFLASCRHPINRLLLTGHLLPLDGEKPRQPANHGLDRLVPAIIRLQRRLARQQIALPGPFAGLQAVNDLLRLGLIVGQDHPALRLPGRRQRLLV